MHIEDNDPFEFFGGLHGDGDALGEGRNVGEMEVFEAFEAKSAFQIIAFTCGAAPVTRQSQGGWR